MSGVDHWDYDDNNYEVNDDDENYMNSKGAFDDDDSVLTGYLRNEYIIIGYVYIPSTVNILGIIIIMKM